MSAISVRFHSEQMTYTTVRIECDLSDGDLSTGTAFFFQFPRGPDHNITVLVTNRHVIEGSTRLRIRLLTKKADGSPNHGDQVQFDLPIADAQWKRHPNSEIDLAILPAGPLFKEMKNRNKPPFVVALHPDDLPTPQQLADLGAVENVIMVGYPSGLWDEGNNLPIARAGITATHPAIDYNGNPEFMIDAACFWGSSGSPVFYYHEGARTQRNGMITMGSPTSFLLGILYAMEVFTAEGEIIVVDVPTKRKKKQIALSKIPMNLGLVIKSRAILDFDALLPVK